MYVIHTCLCMYVCIMLNLTRKQNILCAAAGVLVHFSRKVPKSDQWVVLGLGQTGLCWVYVWWSGFGGVWETPGLIPAVQIGPLLFKLARWDSQFPASVPKTTLVKPITVPHFILTPYLSASFLFYFTLVLISWSDDHVLFSCIFFYYYG